MTRTTEYRYNAAGLLTALVSRNGTQEQVTLWEYGAELPFGDLSVVRPDWIRRKIFPEGDTEDCVHFLTYNAQGQILTLQDQNGSTHAYEYDGLGRRLSDHVTAFGEGVDEAVDKLEYGYSPRGELVDCVSYKEADVVNEAKRTYDGLGQITSEAQSHLDVVGPLTPTVAYQNASEGDIGYTNTTRWLSMQLSKTTRYLYEGPINDALGRISSIVESNLTDRRLATYEWLGASTAAVVTTFHGVEWSLVRNNVSDGGDIYGGLDRFGRLQSSRWVSPDSTYLDDVEYGYDRVGNRTWRRNLLTPANYPYDEHYQYDGLDQLSDLTRGVLNTNRTAIGGSPTWQEGWQYDEMGNWLEYNTKASGEDPQQQIRSYNAGNELLLIDGSNEAAAHDLNGNMTRVPNLPNADEPALTLIWDAWNRLVEVRQNDEGDALVATYRYDALFRRTTKKIGDDIRHYYYSDYWQVIEERLNAEAAPSFLYWWGLQRMDDLLVRKDGTGLEHWAINDGKDVTAVINADSNVVERFAYRAFGTADVLDADFLPIDESIDWIHRFNGSQWDDECAMYQIRFRSYHPLLGRWITRDAIGEEGGLNLFKGFSNTPVNNSDPFGLLDWKDQDPIFDPTFRPGAPAMPVPGTKFLPTDVRDWAITVIEWDIWPYCKCVAKDNYVLERIEIQFRIRVFLRPSYEGDAPNSALLKEDIIKGEMDHVKDFQDWANKIGKPLAEEMEKQLLGQAEHFHDQALCETTMRGKMQQRLEGSASKATNDSIRKYDNKRNGKPAKHFIDQKSPKYR